MSSYVDYTNNTNIYTNKSGVLNGATNQINPYQNDPMQTETNAKSNLKDPNRKKITEKRVKINNVVTSDKSEAVIHPKSPRIYHITNKPLQNINNRSTINKMSQQPQLPQPPQQPQRKPFNANEESNIYDTSVKNVAKDNNFRQLQNENKSPVRNDNSKSFNQPNNTARDHRSPTTSQSNGATRIAKRELWWKEPPPSEAKMTPGGKVKVENVTPRVDHHNPNYKPARESSKMIESRKLQWNKKAITDTWGNFNHKPQG